MAGFFTFTKEKPLQKIIRIPINEITFSKHSLMKQNKSQEMDLQKLANEIAQDGTILPLTVWKNADQRYELIAGAQQFSAARLAGLQSVPCMVLELQERNAAIAALVKQIQQQELSFFEEAEAIAKLISYYGMTQEDAAAKLGKAQSTIANKLRLLRMTQAERDVILRYHLTERHARALLRLRAPEERLQILDKVIKQHLNVEKTELAVEEKIGQNQTRAYARKRNRRVQNVRFFANTVHRAVETMQAAGISAEVQKLQSEAYLEYRIHIPVQPSISADSPAELRHHLPLS